VERQELRSRGRSPRLALLIRDAWTARQAAAIPEEEISRIGEALARHIESLHPPEDMEILSRYGHARSIERINVFIHDGEKWSESAAAELGREVVVAESFRGLWSGGPRYGGSEAKSRGFKPDYWETLSPEKRAEIMKDQDAQTRRRVPQEIEGHFSAIIALRAAYRAEYDPSMNWPFEERVRTGHFPTWESIADRWPVLGAHLRRLWATAAGE
jgi:hypothetical protein